MRSFAKVFLGCAFLIGALSSFPGRADQAGDEAAIKQLGIKWQDAWNERDAKSMSSLVAEDIDFVTVLGPKGWLKGRAQFEEVHARPYSRTAFGKLKKHT